jgi:PERQ amino acid-rich with GYF domain-containing protein
MSAGLNGPASPWSTGPGTGFGAFGSFSLAHGASQSPAGDKKPAIGSIRGESRFKGLLPKDSSEDMAKVKEKSSFGNLERLPEAEPDRSRQSDAFDRKTRGLRSESNPFGDEEPRAGSAALGGAQDMSPQGEGIDHLGFSTFGLASKSSNFRDFTSQDYPQHQTPQATRHPQEPMSPTSTNPYQSPEGDRGDRGDRGDGEDVDTDGSDIQQTHLPGLSSLHHDSNINPFASLRRGGPSAFDALADRSQNSSAGANRGFPNIGGFPGLTGNTGGWPGTTSAIGSPSRGTAGFGSGFGDSLFGPMGDLPSPNIGGLSGNGFFASPGGVMGAGTIGRSSKMGSLFPAAMQEQMRGDQPRQGRLSSEFTEQSEPIGRTMRGSSVESGSLRGDADGSLRGSRGLFGDIMSPEGGNRMRGFDDPSHQSDQTGSHGLGQSQPFGSSDPNIPHASGPSLDTSSQTGQNQSQPSDSPALSQIPGPQQRQMVMPDRMRWIYRDPQGNKQGPWSGLEMHDWYKAGFFTAELQVKKLEDPDYEPLAQLIRRIGNSREPFLVPQIGVPHGPPSSQPNQWAPSTSGAVPTSTAGVAQPPFANSFPSFGTTLTAEQQNALERRKQEEQYLMARQKEHLAQQQVMLKQMQQLQGGPHGIHPHQLQHHSSAHSLHSQPSFGSITSPSGYQQSPNQAPIQPPQPVPGFFDNPLRQLGGPVMGSSAFNPDPLGHVPRNELPSLLDRMSLGQGGQLPFGPGPSYGARPQDSSAHAQQVSAMLQDRGRLQREQEQQDGLSQSNAEQQAHNERLRQFHALQSQNEDVSSVRGSETIPEGSEEQSDDFHRHELDTGAQHSVEHASQSEEEVLSLAEQVQKAAAASSHQSPILQNESPWGKIESTMPQPFPPPNSASPLPAPAAQRNRQNVADQLVPESRSQSQTPIETPGSSIAPWAKETIEGPKGPSLKEIQEAEARKAAQQEEIAAAARRALAEQERLNQPAPLAPGLPSTSTWGSSGSPSTPTNAGSVWVKPATGKAVAAPGTKKTLAQIQKEEEARKQRLAAVNAAQAAATNLASPPGVTGGKRYADLASKIAPSVPVASAGAWTTVGASGKAKAPVAPVVATPVGPRAISGSNPPMTNQGAKTRPTTTTTRTSSTLGATANQNKATDEFTKWAKTALSKGLNSAINGEYIQIPSPVL